MSLNPLDLLEKAINEHGSAVILQQHLDLAKSWAAILEKRNEHLEADHAKEMTRLTEAHRAEMARMESSHSQAIQDLQTQQRQEMQRIQSENAKSKAHDDLEEIEVKILQFLSLGVHPRNQFEIAAHLKVAREKATYYANKLANEDYLDVSATMVPGGGNIMYSLAQKGRGTLIDRGLL